MKKLGYLALFCNELVIEEGRIVDYRIRQDNRKQKVAEAIKGSWISSDRCG